MTLKVLFTASIFGHFTSFHIPYMKLLQAKGFEVWAAADHDPEERKSLEEIGVRCINVPFSRNPISRTNLDAYKQLKRLAKEECFRLIHVHTPVAAFLTRLAFRNKGKGKLLYTAHGFHFYKGSPRVNWLLYFTAEKIAKSWTDGIIVINQEDYENALNLGYPKEQVFFVHGVGVEVPKELKYSASSIRNELGVNHENVVISYIAELNDNKNHQFLLRNWKSIMHKAPEAMLWVIGSGEKTEELERYVAANALTNIHFLGFRRDVPELLVETDIVALLSKREGLPKSIMEAMANKIPCVVTNTRGLRDLVRDGHNGYIVEHERDEQLQQAILALVKDETRREKMGAEGHQLIQPYEIQNVLKEYDYIYERYIEYEAPRELESHLKGKRFV